MPSDNLPFEFPRRWTDIARRLFENPTPAQLEGISMLEMNYKDLEDFLATLGGGAAVPSTSFFNTNWILWDAAHVASASTLDMTTPGYVDGGAFWDQITPSEGFSLTFSYTRSGTGTGLYLLLMDGSTTAPPDASTPPSAGHYFEVKSETTIAATQRILVADSTAGTLDNVTVACEGTHDITVTITGGMLTVLLDGVFVTTVDVSTYIDSAIKPCFYYGEGSTSPFATTVFDLTDASF